MNKTTDIAQSFTDELLKNDEKALEQLIPANISFRGISKEKLIKLLRRSMSQVHQGKTCFYCRYGYTFWNDNLESVVEMRFTSIDYDSRATDFIPLGKRCVMNEKIFYFGLKVEECKVVQIFEPKDSYKPQDIQRLEKLN